jgi:2-C-methyl-D-erythritol 2,4-cyclodiphosphate synthase
MIRCGTGYDVHRLVADRPMIIGGVEIPFEKGPLGHSDGDALAHAIADALLGACALGDIGQHFPDSDKQYAGFDSIEFLRMIRQKILDAGYKVQNIDSTIILEQPKVAPFIPAMRKRIAEALECELSQISVKATTEEGLGLSGGGGAIAAQAVCLVSRAVDAG